MANLITLQDGVVAVVAPVNANFTALNTEVRGVAAGGTGNSSMTVGGVLVGNGTNPVLVTAAGAAHSVLTVPAGGGTPQFVVPQTSDYNYTFNGNLEIWGGGVSALPTGWSQSNFTAPTRYTANPVIGAACVQLSYPGANVQALFYQDIATIYPPVSYWVGRTITFGAWLFAQEGNTVFVGITDDVNTTYSSVFVPDDNAWHFLTVTHTVAGGALRVLPVVSALGPTATTIFIDGLTVVDGSGCTGFTSSGWQGRKAIMQFTTGITAFAPPANYGMACGANVLAVGVPFRGVARNLTVWAVGAPAAGKSDTLQMDGVSTALQAVWAGGGGNIQATDYTHETIVTKGRPLTIRTDDVAANNYRTASIEVEEIPQGI
jgi:hypothetical protein